MAFSWFKRKKASSSSTHLPVESITLRVEDGLLMAFGPEGDPLPPDLVRSICLASKGERLGMETGQEVDQGRVLAILDAQQNGDLSEHRSSAWVKAMLGLGGTFETMAADSLAAEPAGPTPSRPESEHSGRPASEWLTPLAFDDAETSAMKGADAVLVQGLRNGMRLSCGRFDHRLGGWVVRPKQLSALAIQRADGADDNVQIDITAISVQGDGSRWPITSRELQLA